MVKEMTEKVVEALTFLVSSSTTAGFRAETSEVSPAELLH